MDAEEKPETLFFQFDALFPVQNETRGRLLMELCGIHYALVGQRVQS
jgi:hypothetical protein